ncbi:MAG: hypothetical protein ACKVVP_22310 [Chloroflexota bacterium]
MPTSVMSISNPSSAIDHALPSAARIVAAAPSVLVMPRLLEVVILIGLLGIAAWTRIINLGTYSGLFDEGIRVEQLFLMSLGYRPFRDIFAAQGPLLLDLLYPLFRLYGGTLEAARLAVATYSMLGLLGVYAAARQVGGALGGLAAAALLILSTLYLEGSRLALAEVVALGFAAPAIAAVIAYSHSGRRGWLALAAALALLSLLVKPITLGLLLPLALAVLRRGRAGIIDAVIIGAAAALVSVIVILSVGLAGVLDQLVDYRKVSIESEGWSLRKNWLALTRAWAFEPLGFFALAAAGGLAALLLTRWSGLILVAWAIGCVVLLLSYTPLHGKHAVTVIPALAALGGAGIGLAARSLSQQSRPMLIGVALPVAASAGLYVMNLPTVFSAGTHLLRVTADTDVDPAIEQYANAVEVIRGLTGPSDFVVTDHPYLTFLAERMVPPQLVDTAKARIRSRSLTANEAVSIAQAHDPAMVVLWTDRLRPLRPFKQWTEENFRLVKVYNRRNDLDRGIYVKSTSDLGGVRERLRAGMTPIGPVAFAGEIALVGYSIDQTRLKRGEGTAVTLHWEAIQRPTQDHKVVTYVRGTDGKQWDGQQESLSGGSVPVTEWEPGRWLFQHTFVRIEPSVPVGEHLITVGLYDSRARALIPPRADRSLELLESGELVLARVRVE